MNAKHVRPAAVLFVLFALAVFPAPGLPAGDDAMDIFVDGVDALEKGNTGEAHILIQKAAQLDPANLDFRYHLALVYQKMGRDDLALEIYENLTAKNPKGYHKAFFDSAAIYSRRSQHEKAAATLERAIVLDPKDARAHLEAGVAWKSAGNLRGAEERLQRAKALNPELAITVDQILGILYLEEENFDESEKRFEQVRTMAGSNYPEVAKAAEKSLEAVARTRWNRKPWFAYGQLAQGYDDNVVNKPLDPPGNALYPNKEDTFQTLSVSTGYRLLNQKDKRIGLGYTLYHIAYEDLVQGNVMSHSPFVFGEYHRGRLHARAGYDFIYYYTGGASRDIHDHGWYLDFSSTTDKLALHQVSANLGVEEPYGLRTDLQTLYLYKDYRDNTPEAKAFQAGVTQSCTVPKTSVAVRGTYNFLVENSEADNSDYHFHQTQLGVNFPIWWKLRGDLSYAYLWMLYGDNTPAAAHKSRRDKGQNFTAAVTAGLNDMVQLMGTYSHSYNDSNWLVPSGNQMLDLYNFQRNIYTLFVNVAF
jgi:tetratricopeptide (TPR) repeat protein